MNPSTGALSPVQLVTETPNPSFLSIDPGGNYVYATNEVSTWKGQFEAFRHESHGEEMRIVFPHTGDRESLRIKPSNCNENGMDYCLEVSGSSRGVQKYYSRKGWEIRDLSEIETVTSSLVK